MIQGNYIGVNATGSVAIVQRGQEGNGILVNDGMNTSIVDNTISGWRGAGIKMFHGNGTVIQRNRIGTDVTGLEIVGNGGDGTVADTEVQIGGTASGDGNIIAFNHGDGIYVNGTGGQIEGNVIHDNVYLGIDLDGSGVPLLNDTQGHTGPIALTVNASNSLMLAGNSPPPLTGSINGMPFTGSTTYTTLLGDAITMTLSTAATSASLVGQYPITAVFSGAAAGNYVVNPATSTTGTMYVVNLGPDPTSTTGAQAVTFWDNKGNARLIMAADLSLLDAQNLVTQGGSAFDPRSVAQLQAWLSVSPNATTAYQLAVQLAVLDLNVLTGYVHATDLVYAGRLLPYASAYGISGLTNDGFLDVQNLLSAANAMLSQVQPGVRSGDLNQAYVAALAEVLHAADANNDSITQALLWRLVGSVV
jgi:hypothetical protein